MRDLNEQGLGGVTVTLTGIDDLGNTVTQTVLTDDDGNYSFTNLRPGTYQLFETQPESYEDSGETIGTVNGVLRGELLDNDLIGAIALAAGEDGVGYDFGEFFPFNPGS